MTAPRRPISIYILTGPVLLFPSPLVQRPKSSFVPSRLDLMRLQIPFIAPVLKPLKYPESGDHGFLAAVPNGESQSLNSTSEPNSIT
jgi:hypothetical protein